MKSKIFFMVVICTCIILPSVRAQNNPKKINKNGVYQPYYGYTIIAKIHNNWLPVAQRIEQFIRTSKLKKTYAALPANTYHMSIYTIYSVGNKLIPPVKQWVDKGKKIPKSGFLPDQVLEYQNNEATCVLARFLYQPIYIKRATLKFGDRIISLTLELDPRSLNNIRYARKELAKVYKHPNSSLEPISTKVHITLAYIYGKKKESYTAEWNTLNKLVGYFNGAPLSMPSVYLYESMTKYNKYRSKQYVDCKAYRFW